MGGVGSALNFGRWLGLLGFKRQEQPPFHQTVQPVALVADQRWLVSPVLGPSGIVGCVQPAVLAEFGAIIFQGPSPGWVHLLICTNALAEFSIQLGGNGVAAPAIIGATTLVRQEFEIGRASCRERV